MRVSDFISGVSPEFTLVRSGNQVTATFFYGLTGFEDEEGVFLWDGDIYGNIGIYENFFSQQNDRPMDLSFVATLTNATPTTGTYAVHDYIGGADFNHEFTVTIFSTAANFTGTEKADYVFGSDAYDTFHALATGDVVEGGYGSDTYYIETTGVTIIEADVYPSYGDTVVTSVSYTVAAGVSIDHFRAAGGFSKINLIGNEFRQTIDGNKGANILSSGGGQWGDHLSGQGGGDTYIVWAGDTINEQIGNDGVDRVKANESYSLRSAYGIDLFTTILSTATTAINLTGNRTHQEIIGNYGANVLKDGGGVADHLRGLAGNDTYQIYSAGTTIVESAAQGAADRVMAAVDYGLGAGVHVELLTTNGSTGTAEIDLAGNELGQKIFGNAASNILDGKGGIDTLMGMAGADFFAFSSNLAADNVDVITDFNAADDTIYLDSAIFTALSAGALPSNAFKTSAGGPKDPDDRIIYNLTTGNLYYDADGSGAAFGNVKFAQLTGIPALSDGDFIVI